MAKRFVAGEKHVFAFEVRYQAGLNLGALERPYRRHVTGMPNQRDYRLAYGPCTERIRNDSSASVSTITL